MLIWNGSQVGVTAEHLGFIPMMLTDFDDRSAREQINARYKHGGGWRPFEGFELTEASLVYPGDEPLLELARTQLRHESIRLYECSWVAIVQPDGSYEIARVD